MTKGDLIHIPQSSHLMQIDSAGTFILNELITKKPTPGLYISTEKLNGQNVCKVYVESQYWYINEKSVYPWDSENRRKNV